MLRLYTISSLFLTSLASVSLSTATLDSIDISQLLPKSLTRLYPDYEALYVEEGIEEDVIYITKRAPPTNLQRCSDCDYFSPWDEDESDLLFRRSSAPWTSGVNATQRHPVERRNSKKKTIECNDSARSKITLMPYDWPSNEDLEKAGNKNIYDFDPFDKPDQASYYTLKNTKRFQQRSSSGAATNRGVSVEHILEWQVLLDFIQADSGRCAHIAETFSGKSVDIDTKRNYLDSTGKVQTQHAKINEIPINWIAHQYPGKASSESPFISEFVMLHDDVNTRKMILWSEPSSSGSKKGGAAKKAVLVADDSSTFFSKAWAASTGGNEGKCRAVVALRDIIGVYRYHTYPEIQKILTMQIERIGAAFKYLENGPLKSSSYKPMSTTLESQWNAYMKTKYASIITDIEITMNDLTDDLKKTKVKRGWLELLRRGAGKTTSSLCGQESDKAKMNARIDLLLKEYEGKWKNPMP